MKRLSGEIARGAGRIADSPRCQKVLAIGVKASYGESRRSQKRMLNTTGNQA